MLSLEDIQMIMEGAGDLLVKDKEKGKVNQEKTRGAAPSIKRSKSDSSVVPNSMFRRTSRSFSDDAYSNPSRCLQEEVDWGKVRHPQPVLDIQGEDSNEFSPLLLKR